jgi:hypothetical protein
MLQVARQITQVVGIGKLHSKWGEATCTHGFQLFFFWGRVRVVDFFWIFIVLDVSTSSSQCVPQYVPNSVSLCPTCVGQCCSPGSYTVGPIFQLMCFYVLGSVVVWSSSNLYENLQLIVLAFYLT